MVENGNRYLEIIIMKDIRLYEKRINDFPLMLLSWLISTEKIDHFRMISFIFFTEKYLFIK